MTGHKVGRPAGDRHDLAAHLRPVERLPHDRRRQVPRGRRDGRRVPPRAPAQQRHGRGPRLLVPRHRDRRAQREEDPGLGVRRRLPGHPGLRADLRPGRARPSSTGSPATSASRTTSTPRSRCSTSTSTTRSTAATGRTSTRSRSTARATSLGRNRARKNWNSVGDHVPGVPHQHLAGDRRRQVHRHARRDRRHHRATLPRRRQQPVRPGAVPRGLEPRRDMGLAAEPRRSSATTSRSPGT